MSGDPDVIRSIAVTTADVVAALETNSTTARRVVLRVTPPFSGRMRARLHMQHEENLRPDRTEELQGDETAECAPAVSEVTGPTAEGPSDTAPDSRAPIHIDPETLLEDPPPYPRPAVTEDELRAETTESVSVERHREYHTERVEQWRREVPPHIRDRVTVSTPDGPHDVTVKTLHREF